MIQPSTENKVNEILTIKDPFTFEFLGLDAKDAVSESDLEQALMDYLQEFMLKEMKEMGIFRGKYIDPFVFSPITVLYGNSESGRAFREIPPNSRYIKSEDILYNIKKVQQRQVLSEVSLSPANQVRLAEEMNKMARLLCCQFIIATHSPFMLGTLHAKIYNLDTKDYDVCKWSELENVRYFYGFFKKHEDEFEK